MTTINKMGTLKDFNLICPFANPDRPISSLFCCDLLSIAMGKAKQDCCWVTVMANVNTLAVASLADVSCIVLAEGTKFDDTAILKAKEQGIAVFTTDLPVFEAALSVYQLDETI